MIKLVILLKNHILLWFSRIFYVNLQVHISKLYEKTSYSGSSSIVSP